MKPSRQRTSGSDCDGDDGSSPSTSRARPGPAAASPATTPAELEVSVQLSRFHLETLESSATGDVDIRGLCIGIGDRELLVDAHLALRSGVRYSLIGRNGVGKSSLLRACATRAIPSFPRDMKVLYVQQENVPGDGRTPLQTLLDQGSERGRLSAQIASLEAAIDEAGDGEDEDEDGAAEAAVTEAAAETDAHLEGEEARCSGSGGGGGGGGSGGGRGRGLVAAVQAILATRAAGEAAEAEQTAARRSRTRGKEALKAAQQAREAARKAQSEQLSPDAAASLAPKLLAELYDKLDELGGSEEAEAAEAGSILEGLGFGGEAARGTPTRELSGGWRMRVALAVALLARPHLLLLDEPTNHLDIQSILWVQDYLTNRCGGVTVLLVSHDAAFLNAVGQETVVLRDGRLEYFPGTYDAYVQARAEAALHKERQVAGQERQRAHLQDTIARAERAAREAGDDKRLLQAASRRKKIDRLGCDKTADGKRFKVSYWAGYHDTVRPQVELDRPEEPVVIQLPPPEALRQRGPLLQLREVTIAYGNASGTAGVAAVPPQLPGKTATQAASKAQRGGGAAAAAPAAGKGGKAGPSRLPSSALASSSSAARKDGKSGAAAAAAPPPQAPPGLTIVLGVVTLDIEQGSRIGLLGLNGSGKSSLLRVLAGELLPAAGEVASPCSRLTVGCLDQHSGRRLLREADAMAAEVAAEGASGSGRAAPPPTAFSVVQARAPLLKPQEVYDYLGKFAVPGPVANMPLAALSGGQRCRLALALVMLPRPHVLLLDEPTNHLDLLTVQALAAAVREWEGAVVVASHDMRFLSDTCREVWVVEGGRVARQPQTEAADAVADYTARLMERLRRRRGGGGGGRRS